MPLPSRAFRKGWEGKFALGYRDSQIGVEGPVGFALGFGSGGAIAS